MRQHQGTGTTTAKRGKPRFPLLENLPSDIGSKFRGYSTVVVHQLPKLATRVRFPLPARLMMRRESKGAATSLMDVGATNRSADIPRERRVADRSERSERRRRFPLPACPSHGVAEIEESPRSERRRRFSP